MTDVPAARHITPLATDQGSRRWSGHTTSFRIEDLAGTVTTHRTGDGTTAGFDLRVGTHGSTMAGLTDALAAAASLALQHGAPLASITDAWQQTWFVPNGVTDDPDIPHTTSLADYVARRVSIDQPPTGSDTSPAVSRAGQFPGDDTTDPPAPRTAHRAARGITVDDAGPRHGA
ncbi:hypothetical protein [Winogradskya humida]|uniref:hypothetical protein n=1 Tax=Winogradskya humida TaxID=113566 RepID=UPI0019445FD6|nr:hypothetical protein [Actinoplanes humidus]